MVVLLSGGGGGGFGFCLFVFFVLFCFMFVLFVVVFLPFSSGYAVFATLLVTLGDSRMLHTLKVMAR